MKKGESFTLPATARNPMILTGRPQAPEVEGQMYVWRWCECPWCGVAVRILYDTDRYLWYQCGNCGGYFRA